MTGPWESRPALRAAALVLGLLVTCLAAIAQSAAAAGASSTTIGALHVEGGRLIDASGRTVVLRGVNRSGAEYMCAQDAGITDGPIDQSAIAAIKSWGTNAVRLPLNEHCWLGVDDGAPTPNFVGEPYRQRIDEVVRLLAANGLYPILDLHWSAPAGSTATTQRPMPNTSYSAAFWGSVADRFKGDPRVIFDLYNEPVPNNNSSDATDDSARRSWECWRDGGEASCDPVLDLGRDGTSIAAADTVGVQALVNAVRATGATNLILLGGIQWSNTLWSSETRNWLTYRPIDPTGNLAASVHLYRSGWCVVESCFDTEIAPVAGQVPVVATELGIASCDAADEEWLEALLGWLDRHHSGYLTWAWHAVTPGGDSCAGFNLITAYDGTPTRYGGIYRSHLAALPVATRTVLSSSLAPSLEGQAVTFSAVVSAPDDARMPAGSAVFAIDGADAASAPLDASGAATFSATFADDAAHLIVARYEPAAPFTSSVSDSLTQRVDNVAPTVGPIAETVDPAQVGTVVTLRVPFRDAGTADTHTASVDWGDGTVAPALVSESSGSGEVSASHAYAAAGTYAVSWSVVDDDGGTGSYLYDSVVVFDPAAGGFGGAGWFDSRAGAYAPAPAAAGRVGIAFIARYTPGALAPTGRFELVFGAGRLRFTATSFDSLVVARGHSARLTGRGQVGGAGSYGFTLVGAVREGEGAVRLRIWDRATGRVVYDSQPGAPINSLPASALRDGVMHIGALPPARE